MFRNRVETEPGFSISGFDQVNFLRLGPAKNCPLADRCDCGSRINLDKPAVRCAPITPTFDRLLGPADNQETFRFNRDACGSLLHRVIRSWMRLPSRSQRLLTP